MLVGEDVLLLVGAARSDQLECGPRPFARTDDLITIGGRAVFGERFFAAIACACLLSAQSQDSQASFQDRASATQALPGTYTTRSRLQTRDGLTGVEVSTAPGPPRRRRDSWRIDRGPTVPDHRAAAVDTFMFMALGVAPP